jgi:AsmA family/AsmA-like C-terminal region
VQATLLSIAIALILALVAALVGPHFIDWNQYRAQFESQASRMTGLQVRLAGPIDARLLPTPSLNLQRVDIVQPGEAGSLRVRRLSIEFSLGSLVRGEFKASDVILDGAEIVLALDRNGRLEWPAPTVTFDPDAISIERLVVRDSRALLADAASGYGVVLDRFEFRGELRTLSGPVKGQGAFYADGQHYPYRIAASRVGDNRMRLRLNIDPIDRPVTADADGFMSIENGSPRFVGSVTLARQPGRAPAGSQAQPVEPWRLVGKIDGNSARAVVEQIDFQYGPDERPIRLRGDALVNFGATPRLTGVLSSPQLDLDRILDLPESQRRRPLAAIKSFSDLLVGSPRLPFPVSLGISVDSLTLAGATLQRVSSDLVSETNGWNIDRFELRAPGLTQLALSGRLGVIDGISFVGPTRLVSKDPRALIAWLTDRPEDQITVGAGLSIEGVFRLGKDEVAVDGLKAELDRMSVAGRLAYSWVGGQRSPRIEAAVSAPEIDLDRAYGLIQGLFDGTVFELPREGLLTAKIGRATLAGVAAKGADVNVRFDGRGLNIERLAVDDFGGASAAITGTIDTSAAAPRGAIKLDLDARQLDGLAELVARFAPQIAAELRRNADQIVPVKLAATMMVNPESSAAASSVGRFTIAGAAGGQSISLRGEVTASHADLTPANFARLRSASVRLGGEIDAVDGATLVRLLGLDRNIVVDKGGGRITASAHGAFDSDLSVEASLAAPGLDAAASGRLQLAGNRGLTADLAVRIARANLRAPRSAGYSADAFPAAFTTRLVLNDGVVALNDLTGTVAGSAINGRLMIGLADPIRVGGELSLGTMHLPAIAAAVIGVPRVAGGNWPSEPFERGLIGGLEGSVKIMIGRMALSPQLGVADMRAVVQFGRDSIALEAIDGVIAGGRVAGSMSFKRGDGGLSLASQLKFTDASLVELLPGEGVLTGHASIELKLRGTGRSPVALIGALEGEGAFSVSDGAIMRIDPAAFAAVIRSVDAGFPIDTEKIRERTEAVLLNGALFVAAAQGEIAIAAGQLRLVNTAVKTKEVELAVNFGIDLSGGTLDARLILSGAPGSGVLEGIRPEIMLSLRGPFGELKPSLDVAAFANWLALRAIEEKDKRIEALQTGSAGSITYPFVAPATTGPAAPVRERIAPQPTPKIMPPPRTPTAKVSPPTDIRPAPATRPPTSPSQPTQPQRPTTRSWLERLLGP